MLSPPPMDGVIRTSKPLHGARDMLEILPRPSLSLGTEVELLTSQFSPVIRACRFPGKNKFLGARSLMLLKDQGDPGKVLRRVEV